MMTAPPAKKLMAVMRSLRPHQWAKNLIIFVPALAGHKITDARIMVYDLILFAAFCLTASGAYVINDLADIEADRQHHRKKHRPFASGELSPRVGWIMAGVLLLGGLGLAGSLTPTGTVALLVYALATIAYSLWIRKIELVDVFLLAGLYTIRLVAGYTAGIAYSTWLLVFSMFIFISLALVKRFVELAEQRSESGRVLATGRGYRVGDTPLVAGLGIGCGCLAALVLGLYVNSQEVLLLYGEPRVLLLICPLWLYWISHVWLQAHRGEMHDDPVVFALRDYKSYVVGILILVVLWLGSLRFGG